MSAFKTIGVLGGMGPVSTADFYNTILKQYQNRFGAVQDSDYPHIIIDSLSIKGSSERGIEDNELVLSQLIESVHRLCAAGAELIAVTCNTEHVFYKEMQLASPVPVINLIECVLNRAVHDGYHKGYLLASQTTYDTLIYQSALNKHKGFELVIPSPEIMSLLTEIMLLIMGGKNCNVEKQLLLKEIAKLTSAEQIDSVILGCTELPCAIFQSDTKTPVLNCTEVLVQETLKRSLFES